MRIWLTFSIILLSITSANAQALDDYVPPALFDTQPDVMPEKKFKRDKLPMLSKEVKPSSIKIEKTQSQQIEGEKDEQPQAKTLVVIPKTKPKPPVNTPKAKASLAKPSNGVVKGPKTMPANKKQGVESEVIFESNQKPTPMVNPAPVIEQEPSTDPSKTKSAKKQEKPVLPKNLSKTFNLAFKGNDDVLTRKHIKTLTKEIMPQLNVSDKSRIVVQSYAPLMSDNGLAAGRRIALSRALNLRQYIIEQEISPSRIDIRSLSADQKPENANTMQIEIIE